MTIALQYIAISTISIIVHCKLISPEHAVLSSTFRSTADTYLYRYTNLMHSSASPVRMTNHVMGTHIKSLWELVRPLNKGHQSALSHMVL